MKRGVWVEREEDERWREIECWEMDRIEEYREKTRKKESSRRKWSYL